MKAIILAAGMGKRLGDLVKDKPKPMIEVGGKPVLEHNIEALVKYGIREIYINLYYRPEVIVDYFGKGDKFGVKIFYSYEENLLGTAGGVKKIASNFNEGFLVIYGDSMREVDFENFIKEHETSKCKSTIGLYETENIQGCGIVEVDDRNIVTTFLEKPEKYKGTSNYANGGVYFIEPELLKNIPANQVCDFSRDLFPSLLSLGEKINTVLFNSPVLDIGTPKDLELIKGIYPTTPSTSLKEEGVVGW